LAFSWTHFPVSIGNKVTANQINELADNLDIILAENSMAVSDISVSTDTDIDKATIVSLREYIDSIPGICTTHNSTHRGTNNLTHLVTDNNTNWTADKVGHYSTNKSSHKSSNYSTKNGTYT